mgnify:CR=1 FL=1
MLTLSTIFAQDMLTPISWIDHKKVDESSGIIFSKNYANIVWTHNDSGGKARIFPLLNFKRDKKLVKHIKLKKAKNHDFEDISLYMNNKIIVADMGNNSNNREDLKLYIFDEPNPYYDKKVAVETIHLRYPDQTFSHRDLRNFDSEALYTIGKEIYILTKNRSDNNTKLYKVKNRNYKINTLQAIDTFPIGEMVTAADADNDRVVVLTYSSIWLFDGKDENIFNRAIYTLDIEAGQAEAVALKGEYIYITNENRQVFRVKIAELLPYHPR